MVDYRTVMTDLKVSPLKLAVLLSGGGRTMVNLAQAIASHRLSASIQLVLSSRRDAMGIARAEELGLPVQVVERRSYANAEQFSQAVWPLVQQSGANLVCLAGFLSLLVMPDQWVGRMVNIHPALLPAFGGKGMHGHHVHQAVLQAGCKVSGCTVHFCDQQYDTGPIIVQRTCPVREDDTPDTLAARVFEQECLAYPQALQLIAENRVVLEGRRAQILP